MRPDDPASFAGFRSVVQRQIDAFPANRLIRLIECGRVEKRHYHALLTTIFHQTRSAPYSFAEAGANCSWRFEAAKEYLVQHAEEERTHWRWILGDLRATSYEGPDPVAMHPHPTTDAYIGMNALAARTMPVARLATAAVLEGIGATHGGTYGRWLLESLNLSPHQATFFLSHGETDKTHTVKLDEVIAACDLAQEEWSTMCHFAMLAGTFYRAMYDHDAFE